MDRRAFLAPRKKNATVDSGFRTQSGLTPYSGPWTRNEVQHLLKRALFGSRKTDIDYFLTRTMNQAVDELLNDTSPQPSPPLNDYSPGIADPNVAAGATWVNNPTNDGNLNTARRNSFKKWWTGLMINQGRSIREKMTLFWADHFGTETTTIGVSHFIYHHHALLRQNALGNFRQLVKDVSVDAGMLRYLNGYLNTNTAPDENYARELLELFTLGKGSTVQYSEDDVKKAAKILTGWRINTTYVVFFDASKHDSTNKQFSSYFNNATITGQTGLNGALETDDLLNMIFQQEEVSKYICRCLYRWFIYYKIDAAAETNVIEPLATIFRNNNYNVKPVLTTLLKSEHFFDVLNQGSHIKSPVDQVVSCLREFGVVFPNSITEYADAYGMWNYIRNWFLSMNQDIGDPPDVSGWPAYYQEPQFHELWINSDTLPKRNLFTDTMINNGYTRNGKKIVINAVAFAQSLPNPSDPNALIDDSLAIIYRVPLSAASKQQMKEQILLSNQTQDYYWTNAWTAYLANPSDTATFNIVNTRLKTFYQYLMNLPEYQLS